MLLPPAEPPFGTTPAPPKPLPPACGSGAASFVVQLAVKAPTSSAPLVSRAMRTQLVESVIMGTVPPLRDPSKRRKFALVRK
jgi:hypothetical protein